MKKRSDIKASGPPSPTYFTDRDLCRTVPRILREAGCSVEAHYEHFPEDQPSVADEDWIRFASIRDWVCLTKDHYTKSDPPVLTAMFETNTRLIILRGKIKHAQLAELFLAVEAKVPAFLAKHNPPFIAAVRRNTSKSGLVPELQMWKSKADLEATLKKIAATTEQ